MSRNARRGALAAATVALTLTAAACSSSDSGSSPGPGASSSGSSAFQAQHQGGTLKLVAHAAAGTFDPQVNYTLQYWQLFQSMYDGLLAFKKVDGQQSFTVVPDLATAMPKVTNGGKTYTFTLRKGVTFSNGKALTTDDVVASFQRIFKVSSPTAGTFYNGIVGADTCLKTPASCTLSKGVIGDAKTNTVTVNLTAADPEFAYKLAVPHAVVVPKDSPTKDAGTRPLPSTGPYMAASYDPNRALKLVRNPHFKEWSREAEPQGYPDVIDYAFGQTVESEVTAVENGQADWMYDPPPADRLNEIGTKYASQAHVTR
jgi:peptide/nickel transport system substrate-binding protein